MRKILFRGKTVKEQWAYGLLAHIGNAWYISNKAGVATAYEVIPSTVGQFTGLKDKNGTKIFEGDIVRVFDVWCGGVKKVVWWESEASFKLSKDGKTYLCLDTAIEKGCKVIGNIHDNPELLNGED